MINEMLSGDFWKALMIRVVKTWCQAFGGCLAGATLMSDVNWKMAFSAACMAAIICLVWNLAAGLPEVNLERTLYSLDNNPYPDGEEEVEDESTLDE